MGPGDRPLMPLMARRLSPLAVRKILHDAGFVPLFRCVSVMNLKGGVGKTTTAVTLASRAVQYGLRTCVVDIDAQGSATLAVGVEVGEGDPIFRDVWAVPDIAVPKALREVHDFFSILPSGLENSLLDLDLAKPAAQKRAMTGVYDVLRNLGFDLVVIDCPPSLGAGPISAACAADVIVVPAGNDAFSLRGIQLTLEEVATIRETFGLPAVQIRILSTMVDGREKLSAHYVEALTRRYPGLLLPGFIRRSTEFSKALERRETVFAAGARGSAREDYDRVTRALLGLDAIRA